MLSASASAAEGRVDKGQRTGDWAQGLARFIDASPTAFHAVTEARCRLDAAGFSFVPETDAWQLEPGGNYYTIRNDSSLVAFRLGAHMGPPAFRIAAAHVDSPALRIKQVADLHGPGSYVRVNVEEYGSLIERSWLDRPLSVAGRALVMEDGRIRSRLVTLDRESLIIPSVAIHLNRKVNEGVELNQQVDLIPLLTASGADGAAESAASIDALVVRSLGIAPDQLLARDLIVCNRQRPVVWGEKGEFISAPRLDDQQCAYAALEALLASRCDTAVSVLYLADHEEVGSRSMKGAQSSFLLDVLRRIAGTRGDADPVTLQRALRQSFVVSCDNAHATHPNHPELSDEGNRVWLNGGVVIKENAQQRYATDALSRAVFEEVCRRADVPTQYYANRSDIPCGSTIGNMIASELGVPTVDVGAPQLSMHSVFETAGTRDIEYMVRALAAFYDTSLDFGADGSIGLMP